jgi:3-hydroxybutyryl-CoA dehydrogenase
MEIKTVGVAGCGLMGSGIAQVAAEAGYRVVVREVSASLVEKGLSRIDGFLQKGVEKGKLSAERKAEVMGRLHGTTDVAELAQADIVIEAVVESLEAKRELLTALDGAAPAHAIFASNTSSLSITELAAFTKRAQQFVGLHFFNPVPLMKLVEVVRAPLTSPETMERAFAFATSLGKSPVRTADKTGFIVNRLLVPYLLDAIRALEEGVGSIEDIDKAMQLGSGHPMGPFTLLDFVGLDTIYYIGDIMFDEFREKRFAPPPSLKRMVQAGFLGKKSGKGFYDYAHQPPRPVAGLV